MAKRVLLVNKFYYPRGGDCVVMMNTERLLRDHGCEVAIFAMQYPDNVPSPWSKYFATEVGITGKLPMLRRTLGWGDVKAAFCHLLDDFQPEVVHLHNIHSYLSPVLAQLAKQRGCRVVWTLHDYKLLCPAYSCMRQGVPCEACYNHKTGVVKHRCMKGSLAASAVAWLEAMRWNRKVLEKSCDAFICPSAFMAQKMAQGGFSREKLKVLCNFNGKELSEKSATLSSKSSSPYYCYVGRLSQEKGVATLLKAAAQLPFELRLAGGGPLLDELKTQYANQAQIKFLGHQNAQAVSQLLAGARCSVMPSECYENNPLGLIESLCEGTPVVGAEMGGIPELIAPHTGLTYVSGNVEMLKKAIVMAMERQWNYEAILTESRQRFSPETHYNQLLALYQ